MTDERSVERRFVTVLFADLVGFTTLSEELDAEEVAAVQDAYFGQVRETIARYGGQLEKFIGDAAMAAFGVPRTREDDAERAVRAGLALTHAVDGLAGALGLAETALQLRVGINSGEVAYSPSDDGAWRVSGDAVNVAARLQAATEPGSVLVGEATAFAVADSIALDPPVTLQLKGKSEPIQAWRAVTVLPHRSRERVMGSLRAPLLGRQQEMGQLSAALERVRGGVVEVLVIVAPPGVGKTRLVEEFAQRAAAGQRGVVLRRARLGPETVSPAAAVAQLFASAGDAPKAPPAQAPGASSATGARLAGADLARERRLRFATWIGSIDELAEGRPQVWLVEDIHWSGGDVLAFIEQAGTTAVPGGRLILATARPSLLEQLAQRPADGPTLAVLELPPLDEPSTGALLDALVGEALPPRLRSAILERADGNPLFVEELLRSWVNVGALVGGGDGGWSLTREIDDVGLPQTVQAIYAGQLDDLPTPTRTLVRRAAVAGRRVPRRSLPVLELADADDALAAALRRALLQNAPPDPIVGAAVSYRHALLRDAGYASLARADRARLHARLARWYEQAAGAHSDELAEVIARHYAAAVSHSSRLSPSIIDELDRPAARRLASGWYERAAQRALAGAAHETARELLREGLAHADEDDHLRRGRLLLSLGEATAYTADMDEGIVLMHEALANFRTVFETATDEPQRALARSGYAEVAAAIGRAWVQQIKFDDARRLANETLAAIGGPDDAGVARLLGLRAWLRATLERERAALADLERGLRVARELDDRRLELDVLHWRAMALGELDMVEQSDWEAVDALAHEQGDWSRAVKARRVRAAWLVDDEAAKVWPLAEQAEEVCRRLGLEEDLAWIDYLRAEAGFVSGEWERALAAGLRAIDLGERNAYHRAVVRTWHVLLPIAEARGDAGLIERAHRWFEPRRGTFPDSAYARVMYWVFELRFVRAGLRPSSQPDVAALLPSFESELGGPSWISAQEDVLEAWLAAGELAAVDEALRRVEQALAKARDPSALARGCARYLRARLREVAGAEPAELADLADEALVSLRHSRAAWWIWKSLRIKVDASRASPAEATEMAEIGARLRLAATP